MTLMRHRVPLISLVFFKYHVGCTGFRTGCINILCQVLEQRAVAKLPDHPESRRLEPVSDPIGDVVNDLGAFPPAISVPISQDQRHRIEIARNMLAPSN